MNKLSLLILSLAFILNACTTTKEVDVEYRTNPSLETDKLVKGKLDKNRKYQFESTTRDGVIISDSNIDSQALVLADAAKPEDLLAHKRRQDVLANNNKVSSEGVNDTQESQTEVASDTQESQTAAASDTQELQTEVASETQESEAYVPEIEQENNLIYYFTYDSINLDQKSVESLIVHAKKMQQEQYLKLRLEGHTDERGSRNYNLALGENRALAIRDIFTLYDVDDRIEIVSYGEEKPQAYKHNTKAWQKNRRVELIFY